MMKAVCPGGLEKPLENILSCFRPDQPTLETTLNYHLHLATWAGLWLRSAKNPTHTIMMERVMVMTVSVLPIENADITKVCSGQKKVPYQTEIEDHLLPHVDREIVR